MPESHSFLSTYVVQIQLHTSELECYFSALSLCELSQVVDSFTEVQSVMCELYHALIRSREEGHAADYRVRHSHSSVACVRNSVMVEIERRRQRRLLDDGALSAHSGSLYEFRSSLFFRCRCHITSSSTGSHHDPHA